MTETRATKILQLLQQTLGVPSWTKPKKDPFETLIATIISQNTTDSNTAKAFEILSKHFEIKPEVLARAQINQIEESLHVAGLYKSKAKTIKHVSKAIVENFHGNLS